VAGYLNNYDLRMNLFNLYIFIEIGGTGGGCFRYMYSRFLKEVAKVTKNTEFEAISEKMSRSGEMFSEIGQLFKNPEFDQDLGDRIRIASDKFKKVADLEEDVFTQLSTIIQ
jgi:hypothetical protein